MRAHTSVAPAAALERIWGGIGNESSPPVKKRTVVRRDEAELVVYDQIHAAVVSDRDVTIRIRRSGDAAHGFDIAFESTKDLGPPPAAGYVRLAAGARQLAHRAGARGWQQHRVPLLQRAGRRDSGVSRAWSTAGFDARRVRARAYESGTMKRLLMTMHAAPGRRRWRGPPKALPPVADVVTKARAAMDKKADDVMCKVIVDTQLLDKTGKPEHDEHREGKATFRGDDMDIESLKVTRDGKEMTADELADERNKVQKDKKKRKKGEEEFDLMPLSPKNVQNESFELVRQETLWGRPTLVVKVRAQKKSPKQANGTLWIDAEKFVVLKAELSPSAMPPHADWIKVQQQFVPGPKDAPVPSFLHIEGAGHMWMMHKQFRTTLHWSDCR